MSLPDQAPQEDRPMTKAAQIIQLTEERDEALELFEAADSALKLLQKQHEIMQGKYGVQANRISDLEKQLDDLMTAQGDTQDETPQPVPARRGGRRKTA